MTLKHAATATGSPLIGATDWNADHLIDTDGATMATRTDAPAAPAAGKMVVFGKTIAGGALPAFIGPSGFNSALQPFLGRNKIVLYTPFGNATGVSQIGIAVNASGTATARNVATTNLFTATRRHGYVTPTTANSRALISGGAQFFLSSVAGMGGFRYIARFGVSDASVVSGANMFVGLSASSGVATGAAVAASTNLIGMGIDAGDSNMQIFYNDASGAASKIDLGANFPANTTNSDLYEIALFAPSGSAAGIYYQATRVNTGDTASAYLTTDIPAANQLMLPLMLRGNMSTGLAVGLDIALLYIETDN